MKYTLTLKNPSIYSIMVIFSHFISTLTDAKPSLITLSKFPGTRGKFNVMERIGRNYATFGVFLLQDDDGARVSALEHGLQRDPLQICQEIVKQWLQGRGKQPVTYAILVGCLRDAGLNTLANDIEDVLQ